MRAVLRALLPGQRRTKTTTEPAREPALPELEDIAWYAHAEEAETASFWRMARRLPGLVRHALRTAWTAAPGLTVMALALNIVAGVATTTALLAVTDVTGELFAAGPTLDRVIAAGPSLVLLAATIATRAGLGIAAGWAQQRLEPIVLNRVESRFFRLTCEIPRAAFDDDKFADRLEAAKDRGNRAVVDLVTDMVDLVTGLVNVAAIGVALIGLFPISSACCGWSCRGALRECCGETVADSHDSDGPARNGWLLSAA